MRARGIVAVAGVGVLLGVAIPAWAQPASPDAPGESKDSPRKKKKRSGGEAQGRPETKPAPPEAASAGKTPQDEEFGPQLPPPPPTAENVVVAAPRRPKFGAGRALVGARVGGAFPEVVSNFGPSFIVGAEIGWVPRLPRIGEGFAVTLDFAYSQPEASSKVNDPLHADSGATASISQREFSLGLTVLYRVPNLKNGRVTPYLGIGPRVFMLETLAKESQGSNVGTTYKESSTRIGMGIPVGVDFVLGPGRLFFEAMFLYAPFNHHVTGATNAGALTVEAGYRFLFNLGG